MLIIKKSKANFLEILIKIMTLVAVIPVFLIIGYIIYTGIPAISWEFLSEMPTDGMRAGGIFPAICWNSLVNTWNNHCSCSIWYFHWCLFSRIC